MQRPSPVPPTTPALQLATLPGVSGPLITAEQLLLAGNRGDVKLVLLDVRWKLGEDGGHRDYLRGHLPGAVFVDFDHELAGPPSRQDGRHPLPSAQQVQRLVARAGIEPDSTVVAYDDWGALAAARAWWVLRWAGVPRVLVLDGGLAAWSRAGGTLPRGEVTPGRGTASVSTGALPVLDADTAGMLARTGVLADAREPERYRGESEPLDSRAGHIPGAVSLPTRANLAEDGTFRAAPVLAERFTGAGLTPGASVGAYCGSGVTAAHLLLAMRVAGIDGVLYPGSWSQWSADPARPAATGAEPG